MDNSLSVLMSAYNSAEYVGRTIDSVLNQTYKDFEFIIIENGSTDTTRDVIRQYDDSRIKVIELNENIGLSGALNLGLKQTQSRWIARIDSDDLWTVDKLEKQIRFLTQHQDYCLVASWVDYIDANDNKIGESREPLTSWKPVKIKYDANKAVVFCHSSVIFDRADVVSVGGYHGQFWPTEDADLWNRLLETGKKMQILPLPLTLYRIYDGGNSITKLRQMNLMFRYTKYCMRERRAGRPEPTLAQYKSINKGFWKNVNEARKDYAIYHYKKAVASYSGGRYVPFAYHMLISAFINPSRMLSTLKNKKVR